MCSTLPGWLVARGGLRLSLEGNQRDFGESIHQELTPGTSAVLVWSPPDEEILVWLTAGNLGDWGTDPVAASELASANMRRLLDTVDIVPQVMDGHRVGVVQTDSIFKSSLLLAPGFRQKVEPIVGWPVRAVAPCRDFLLLFADGDHALIPKLSGLVAHEFEGDPNHALTLEVLRVSDAGLSAVGAFAEVAT